MRHLAIPAVFMRGGTSRAVMFHARDLPERAAWDPIFLAAMGSPDPNGRQLNGMGGGVSSLSKVCVLAPSERADADIDYTSAQVQIKQEAVSYRANCGPAPGRAHLSGDPVRAHQVDLTTRFISNGQPHRALPVTSALCSAVAARIAGTLPNQAMGARAAASIRIGMPSGVLTVDADVAHDASTGWIARSGTFYRTARRLFDGRIHVPVDGRA